MYESEIKAISDLESALIGAAKSNDIDSMNVLYYEMMQLTDKALGISNSYLNDQEGE